jgi:hypothetical protein
MYTYHMEANCLGLPKDGHVRPYLSCDHNTLIAVQPSFSKFHRYIPAGSFRKTIADHFLRAGSGDMLHPSRGE